MALMPLNPVLFFSGCQPQPKVSDANTQTCQPLETMSFPDATSAIEHIEDSVEADPILAFGYTHRETSSQPSAVEIFAREIIPQLTADGYTDLVLEIFPQGGQLDTIELEIAEFNRSGIIGKEMDRFLNVVDRENFELLLQQVRTHGISIHSGGVNYNNVYQTIWYPNFTSHPQRVEQARTEIAQNTRNALVSLAAIGQRVFSFNGTIHNDIYPNERNASASFGEEITRTFSGSFVEIDMVLPELSARNDYHRDLPLSSNCSWERFIPSAGVSLVSEQGLNSYLLFWPE